MEVEKELGKIDQLNYVILRPAIIYRCRGSCRPNALVDPRSYLSTSWGDSTTFMAQCTNFLKFCRLSVHGVKSVIIVVLFQEVHNNTVHVIDVCRAIWHICNSSQVTSGQVFHVSDDADTTLGDLAEIIADLFEIKYKFVGKMLSTLAKVSTSFHFIQQTIFHFVLSENFMHLNFPFLVNSLT